MKTHFAARLSEWRSPGRDWREKLAMTIAWSVPKSIAYWVFVRMSSNTDGNPADRTCGDVLKQHHSWGQ